MRGSSQLVLLALLTLVKPRTGQLLLSTKKPEQQDTLPPWHQVLSDGEQLYCVNASSVNGVTQLLYTAQAQQEELAMAKQEKASLEDLLSRAKQRLTTLEDAVKQIGDCKLAELCQVEQWSSWSVCSKTCDAGVQSRVRVVASDLELCPPSIEKRVCNLAKCIDCSRGCTTYVRWGDQHCPLGRERLVLGIAAGSGDQDGGGGYNTICLNLNTNFQDDHSDKDQAGGRLYAAEYETSSGGIRELQGLSNAPVPCALCKVQSMAVIVVPGTKVCPSSWVTEYWGYVMSNADRHKKGEYMCVVHNATQSKIGGRNQHQLRWYPVEINCGTLPCPPFAERRELTCVVCSLPENTTGSSYIRWGRHECPHDATTVYKGLAAGSAIGTVGGGANPLCVVETPTYGDHSDLQNSGSSVVGAIYGTRGYGIRDLYSVHGKQIPCILCLVTNRSVSFNYPGRNDCPSNFELAYNGYMFAAHYSHQKNNWICVDQQANGLTQTNRFSEAVWYPTEITCSGISCESNGGYVSNRELTCAVCTSDSSHISSMYIDWGKRSCSGSAYTVYSGFIAGSDSGVNGNGANLNCMPQQANYLDHWDKQQRGALLSGFEYEYGLLSNHEVPCAVCETGHPATFTQVGRNTCPQGFTVQYIGYLFSNLYSASKGEFICIDNNQDYYGNQGDRDDNAGRLYRVETQCGSLPCPPFTDDREVACAVCAADSIANTCQHYRHGKFCVMECPKRTYVGIGQSCHDCHDQCLEECYGPGNQKCIGNCKAFKYRASDWKIGAYACVEACPNGTYPLKNRDCIPESESNTCGRPGRNESCWDSCGVCGGDNSTCRPKAVYYHWGSDSCHAGSRLLYVGLASSSLSSNSGSGYNLLCLPSFPNRTDTFHYMHNDVSHSGGLLYGVEYQTSSSGVKILQHLSGSVVACAACEASKNGIFTISGTNVCPRGWVREYSGFLMSSHYSDDYKSEFVCVDGSARRVFAWLGSHSNLYTTEYGCGNLPCPKPFVSKREVTCAVCSSPHHSGTVYTRWGQNSCGNKKGVETVYHGIAAGSHSEHQGSGANAVCLTENVGYTHYSDSSQPGAYLYGIQYQSGLGIRDHNFVNEHLAACSVCFVADKQSYVMIPGTTFCPNKWKPLYSGYIYGGYHSQQKANWECVDESPMSLAFEQADQARWYPTQIVCGSIPCSNTPGSYVQYREVACTVCQPDTARRSVLYTRWGHSDCPTNSRKVYSGFAAGSDHSESGNGANILCMNASITYGDHMDLNQDGSRLYGVEYSTSGYGLRGHFQSLDNHEVPCVICEQLTAEAGFTQFGSARCPLNYIDDYSGYAFSPRSTNTKGEYICVDKDAHGYRNGRGASNDNQGEIFPVEIECGSQPCPPYVPDREVICVHCSLPSICCPLRWENECVSECPLNSFVDGRFCKPCHVQCDSLYSCAGPTTKDCAVCANFKLNKTCVEVCPIGFVSDGNKTCLMESECTIGYDDCGVCGGNGSTCNVNAVYVRWGRTVCPNRSTLLYVGTSASSSNEQSGSGHNRLCLQNKPSFGFGHADSDYNGAEIFGAAYNTSRSGISQFIGLHGYIVPCAVCETHLAGVLTIPAATECPEGFVVEYQGFIMANNYRQYRGEHVCIDVDAEAGHRSTNQGNEAQMHFTEFHCGALPCSKFPSNREVPCVVCSRKGTGGATYVNWGKSSCYHPSQVVYSGYAASGRHSERGGGANPLCLHGSPSYGLQHNDSNQNGARLYGAKYGTSAYGIGGPFPFVSSYTIPCTVCFVPLINSVIQVTGRSDCPTDWKLEYSGYLFAAHYTHYKTNWVCVNEKPDSLTYHAGSGDWWYPTEVECGSIACDNKYRQDKEVTCAICSADTERYSVAYTHWGRSDCPSGSRIVYSGQAVGSHYQSESGSGANILCLHSVTLFGLFHSSSQDGARLYGYEYEPRGLRDGTMLAIEKHEVPCAVCENIQVRSTFTVFGSDNCPTRYQRDYTGYVFSHSVGSSNQHRGEFVCIDREAQSYGQRSTADDNQAQLYPVEVESCRLIPCPPYYANRELDCARCSRPLITSKVAEDCIVSEWSAWSVCSKPCSIGKQLRKRMVTRPPSNGGRLCPFLNSTTICNVQACADVTVANTTYIHWGRADCPGSSTVLHTGIGASSRYNHQGGGYNYICLPSQPKPYADDPYYSDAGQGGGYVYGVEYDFSYLRNFSAFSRRSITCARCGVQRGPVITMLGTTKCPSQFNVEYTGYIMATGSSRYKSEYICVDFKPSTTGSYSGSDHGLIYPSEYECGGLACPPFVSHREAACAVCSSDTRSGSSYIQWGKKSCTSADSSLIYGGFAAGSLSSQSGNGANSICVISGNNQTYLDYNDRQQSVAQLHAVKLVSSGYGIQTMQRAHNRILPCALCFLDSRYSVIMVPARTECPSGWQIEYQGYLFSAHYSQQKNDWRCVDKNLDNVRSYSGDQANLYPVEIECGSISCERKSRYVQDREISCVVCSTPKDQKSATFMRWGRGSCPAGSTLVYNGFAGGAISTQTGSGTSLLCMPQQAQYDDFNSRDQPGGRLYGFEYETSGYGLSSQNYQSVHNYEVPCAMCNLRRDAAVFVHFGEHECPRGYTTEYTGYTFSNQYSDKSKGEYVCIDKQPEGYDNGRGSSDDDEGRLFPVEVRCGALPCPPYTNRRELKCAVCSWIGTADKRMQDCEVGQWSSWSSCSVTCGHGTSRRYREVTVKPLYGIVPCDKPVEQSRSCYDGECPGPAFTSRPEEVSYDSVTTYIRWGMRTCPPHARTVTTGRASGAKQGSRGSGFNRLCLADSPDVGSAHHDNDHNGGLLVGAEYKTSSSGLKTLLALNNLPIPCSICETNGSAVLMVPGSDTCPAHWYKEYSGYLMANHYSHNRGEYACLDRIATSGNGSADVKHDGWYPVEAECGTLHCPPYVQDRELACVVCSLPDDQFGSTYVRWGRKQCPKHAEKIYSGQVAGPAYSRSGSGANPLCLTMNPSFGDHDDKNHEGARIYGVNYATNGYGLPKLTRLHMKSIPCTLCYLNHKSSPVTIPASHVCPQHWSVEYRGYLFAAHYNQQKANFICIDQHAEALSSTTYSQSRLYPTEVKCGTITCSRSPNNYAENKEMACVVCRPNNDRATAVYTHWGSNRCSSSVKTREVYSGFTAGAHYSHSGSGANMLCLPSKAKFVEYKSTNEGGALLYGYEYYTSGYGLSSTRYLQVHHTEVPCSVCENINRFASLTLFGKSKCPSGYTLDYTGYMFSNGDGDYKGQYLCVDSDAESYTNARGSSRDSQGRLFPVEVLCGSIPCPPYTNNREIVCAQCTRRFDGPCNYYIDQGACVRKCPSSKYADLAHKCQSCQEECYGGCTGPLASECTECRNVKWNGTCLTECPPGTVSNTTGDCVSQDNVDCAGVVDGHAVRDKCGVCNGDGKSCGQQHVYVRWGRTYCSTSAKLLYTGYMAGSHHGISGDGYNKLCLPVTPLNITDWRQNDNDNSGSKLYGVQYMTDSSVRDLHYVNGKAVPCAVCETRNGPVVTIAGSYLCPLDWTVEYEGYIMSSRYTNGHQKEEYVCVDRKPEIVSELSVSNQAYLYPTEGVCGSLHCPPYVNNREITCAVCSRPDEWYGGTVYIRWGFKQCPDGCVSLYSGQAAGSHQSYSGSGANPLCLTFTPAYMDHNDGDQSSSKIYGARFAVSGSVMPTYSSVYSSTIPCTVCYRPQRHSNVMVVGQHRCPASWSLEYWGYLLGARYSNQKSNWICSDATPDFLSHSSSAHSDWYSTEVECGSLQCKTERNGYLQDREVTCSVCSPSNDRRSSVYVRWGRLTCPESATMVYAGMMSGASHSHSGSGANYMCLHAQSSVAHYDDRNQDGARLYGYEYEVGGLAGTFENLNNKEVACAVCENQAASTTFTLFGNVTCPGGYRPDFIGFAFSNHPSHRKGEYVCIDMEAETFTNFRGSRNDDQGRITPAEFRCGTLPCPPFTAYREVPCVQCSKVVERCVFFVLGKSCVQSCPEGFYNDSEKICRNCHEQCVGCVGPSAADCLACRRYRTADGLCVSSCPSDYSPDPNGVCLFDKGKKVDCAGIMNGSKKVDRCGICGGDGSTCDVKAIYVRWGEMNCPSTSKLLFTGYAAGSHDTHSGGGYNSLCVHSSPSTDGAQNDHQQGAYLYGFAYGTRGYGVEELQGVHSYGIPCAVCEAKRGDVFMVPGTTTCPKSFRDEYNGYLVTVRNGNYYRGEYVCLDRKAQIGAQRGSGSLWVPTEFKCGSLPCPPYTASRKVTCVVCSPPGSRTGVVFTRWGKRSCPSSSTEVYSGRSVGPFYNAKGSGANPLCLVPIPLYFHHHDGDESPAELYGAQYATNDFGLRSLQHIHYYTIACALCFLQDKSAVIMSPGQPHCPADYRLQYWGYLFAAHSGHHKSNWVCIDYQPDTLEYYNFAHALWYPTEVGCGGMSCGTSSNGAYMRYHEVTCAVCSLPTTRRSSVYVHYGCSDCPPSSNVVYAGFLAGSRSSEKGNGASLLCMQRLAIHREHNSQRQSGAHLNGYEYETSGSGLNSQAYQAVHNREIPCVVCENLHAESTFMQHGSNSCPPDYVMEYSGFLFANRYNSYKGQYVCVDNSPQGYSNNRGSLNDNYGQLYPVEIQCSGLPCPPYKAYREVACAQCSKVVTLCPGYTMNGTCFISCPPGTYGDSMKTCQPCHPLCSQLEGCTGPGKVHCVRCAFVTVVDRNEMRCESSCPTGFLRTFNNTCVFSALDDVDCEGVLHGGKTWDVCGVCGGTGETCNQMAVYTRWGRSSCPSQSRQLFSGFASSSSDGHRGSGFTRLCLSHAAGFAYEHYDTSQNGALIYGAEYETISSGVSSFRSVHNQPVPCSVCEARRGSAIMIPGSTLCPNGWSLEYYGFLMSNYYQLRKGEYVCVDSNPEKGKGSAGTNDNRWYTVEMSDCGNILCPPYVRNREITCAVCTPPTNNTGDVYIRWGRSMCPTAAQELYKGQAVNSRYDQGGGGVNPLCLTLEPSWANVSEYSDKSEHGGKVYSAILYPGDALPSLQYATGKAVPCVACYVADRQSFMAVGQPDCPFGWRLEYAGYLFAALYNHQKSDWTCVDKNPESYLSSSGSSYWYPTEIKCGTIGCSNRPGGYVANREATCGVCSSKDTRKSSVFTRWGRSHCPAKDTLIYSGFVAGAYHSHSGSGGSMLCVRSQASYMDRSGKTQDSAQLFGFQYATTGYLGGSKYSSVNGYQIPCAVCENRRAVVTFTQFGSPDCPQGYVEEFSGYVFASYFRGSNYKTSHICVDRSPSYSRSGNGHGIVYPVETECGSLPCPPYVQDRELICVQCSRLRSNCPFFTMNDSTCVVTCPEYTYSNSSDNTCHPCDVQCDITGGCNGPGPRMCKKCKNKKHRKVCVKSCPVGTRADYQNKCIQISENLDCSGVPNGNKTFDACGVCGGDNSSCNVLAVYTRWGREDCSGTSRLLFKGFAAGSHYGHTGSGYNVLCLPHNPSRSVMWDHNDQDQNQNGGLIYGVEYDTNGYGIRELFGVAGYQVPCAVCETNASVTVMIPGTTECPANPKFSLEYSGYLMSSLYHGGHYKGEYVCVDREANPRTVHSNQGRLLHPTETECGTLPCRTFTTDREVSCVVCATTTMDDVASVFTNWGRKSCPDDTEQLYTGYAAASYYSHQGSGANMVCLTAEPRYHQYNDGNQNGALLYGVMYALNLPSYGHVRSRGVPCSLCLTHSANTLMAPGRSDCPSDWTAQYSGYLVAAYHSYTSKLNWECLNEKPEADSRGSSSSGTYLYQTEIECGSIKCRNQEDRYVQDRELTCAVCSSPVGRQGVVFNRWGKSVCPSISKLLYSGFAAGSVHSQSGSGANVLCMREEPTYGEFDSGNNHGALLYGYEYNSGGLRSSNFTSLNSYEVPCAVCEVDYAMTTYTVFGSDECPVEYVAIYTGYAFSHHYSHTSKGEYVCVDEMPEGYDNSLGGSSHSQAILYPVEVECGSLPCPPYHQNREIRCAQCIRVSDLENFSGALFISE